MADEQLPRIEFCYRPVCEKPSGMDSPILNSDSCPVVNDDVSPPTASECAERIAAAMAARALCPNEQAPQPPERPLCPPSGDFGSPGADLPAEGATRQGILPCGAGDSPITDGTNTQGRPICVPPEAFADRSNAQGRLFCVPPQESPNGSSTQGPPQASPDGTCTDCQDPSNGQSLIQVSATVCSPPEDVVEDTRPPQIAECREPPSTNMSPVGIRGACSSAEGKDPGEVRCCIKRCEISPEIFEKDPCALPLPDGPLTSDLYKTTNLPFRFNNASGFVGYGCQQQPPVHPFYRTTSQDYGWFKPSVHTVPQAFFPVDLTFSKEQGVGGRYRNTSLDTAMAEKLVED